MFCVSRSGNQRVGKGNSNVNAGGAAAAAAATGGKLSMPNLIKAYRSTFEGKL